MPAAFAAALGDWVRSSRWWIDYSYRVAPGGDKERVSDAQVARSLPQGEVRACSMPAESLQDSHRTHIARLATNAPAPGLGREQRDAARFRRAATGRNAAARGSVRGSQPPQSAAARNRPDNSTSGRGGGRYRSAMHRADTDAALSEAALAADGVQRVAVRFGHRMDQVIRPWPSSGSAKPAAAGRANEPDQGLHHRGETERG